MVVANASDQKKNESGHTLRDLAPQLISSPVTREQLLLLAQPALDVVGEHVGVEEVPATVDAVLAAQASEEWTQGCTHVLVDANGGSSLPELWEQSHSVRHLQISLQPRRFHLRRPEISPSSSGDFTVVVGIVLVFFATIPSNLLEFRQRIQSCGRTFSGQSVAQQHRKLSQIEKSDFPLKPSSVLQ
jgi:hypothetical protein